MVGADGVIRAGFGRVVGRARAVRRVLGELLVGVEREIAVDLAGRDVVKPVDAGRARGFEQGLGAEDVGAEEATRIDDGEAVVRLGSEVDDRVELLLAQHALGELAVADVSFDEDDPVVHVLEACSVARVGEQVEDDDVIVRVPLEPVADEVRADEPGAAGDEDPHRRKPSGRTFGACLVANGRVLWPKSHAFVAVAMTVYDSSSGQSTAGTANAPSRGAATATGRAGARGTRAGRLASAAAGGRPALRCAGRSRRAAPPDARARRS